MVTFTSDKRFGLVDLGETGQDEAATGKRREEHKLPASKELF
jgi:hypothetical protein